MALVCFLNTGFQRWVVDNFGQCLSMFVTICYRGF